MRGWSRTGEEGASRRSGQVALRLANLAGSGRGLDLRWTDDGRERSRLEFGWREPLVGGTPLDAYLTVGHEVQKNVSTRFHLDGRLRLPGVSVRGGTASDDGNAVAGIVYYDADCSGARQLIGCHGVPGGTAKQGTRCDDGDPTTVEDKYDANCLCHGYKAKQTMPLIKSDSQANRCSTLHVLASAKPRPEWNVGDVDVMKVKVDPGVYTGAPNSQQGLEEKGASLNGLVYVNDSLRLLLSSPDECFKITGINPDQSIRSSDTLVFTWSITAEKTPSKLKDDRTTLEVNSYTLD